MFILTRVFSFGFADPKISDDVGFLISIVGLQENKIFSLEFSMLAVAVAAAGAGLHQATMTDAPGGRC